MDEQIMDASSAEFNDFDLTGEAEDFEEFEQSESEQENSTENTEHSEQLEQDSSNSQSTQTESTTEDHSADQDFTLEVLRLKGISDPSKIKFEDQSGAIVERDWNDLTESEKLNILAATEDPERDLEDEEIQFINILRSNNLTPQQYIQAVQQQAADLAVKKFQEQQVPKYEIDSYSDDELFVLDFLERVGEENVSDEELQEALEHAKANETLYQKQIESLRTQYKNLEDQQKYAAEQARIQQSEQQYQEFANKVLNEIGSFTSFAGQELELSTDDKNDIANYMLTRRETGISDFYTDMQDPETATLAAFWLLRGPEIMQEMESQIRDAYQRGFNMGKGQRGISSSFTTPKVVVQPKTEAHQANIDSQSAFGLEDESYLN